MTENLLRDTVVEMTAASIDRAALDDRSLMIARLAALVAVDAPASSYLLNLAAAAGVGMEADDVQALLIAVAPIVGTPKVVRATVAIAEALGIGLGLEEALADSNA